MMKRILAICLLGGSMLSMLHGQIMSSPFWRPANEASISNQSNRAIVPSSYQVWSLNEAAVGQHLAQTPLERNAAGQTQTLALPSPDGHLERFALVKVPIMEPGLSAKYPGFETYAGVGIDNPHVRVRMDMTPHGFHAWVLGDGSNYYIDPYSKEAEGMYIVYHSDDQVEEAIAACGNEAHDHRHDHEQSQAFGRATFSFGEDLLTYRMAATTAAPYTIFHGGTKADALSAVTTVLNRVNMMYESEFSIRLILVANTDTLFFTDLATNPFTQDPTALGSALPINQTITDARIGSANYDVGHVFSRAVLQPGQGSYTAGIANLAAVCNNSRKARGASATPTPIGNGFEGIVMHELGHQFNSNHGFNSDFGTCGAQRSGTWAFQPGGGTTIMCYPGVCGPHNVQNSRDMYFHTGTQEQIYNYTRNGGASGCAVVSATGNQAPSVDAGSQPLYLPVGTPFKLVGDGGDPDGQPLTYVWEQIDAGPGGDPNFPSGTAPLFRTFTPVDSAVRVIPQWSALFAGQQITGEILPTYERPINFRLTARDGLGGINNSEVSFDVSATAGPFQVTAPNSTSQHQWEGGSYQLVTWDVAGTDGGLFNVETVNIKLDIDDEPDFPYTLALNTPNDGEEVVLIPDVATFSGRVMVEAVDHIFFDVSDEPITLSLPANPGFSMFLPDDKLQLCLGDSVSFEVYTASQQGFQEAIDFFAIGIPFGMQITSEPGTTGDTLLVTFTTDSNLVAGTYNFQVFGESLNQFEDVEITVEVTESNPQIAPVLLTPNGTTGSGVELLPVLTWVEPGTGLEYEVEISADPDFVTIIETASTVVGDRYDVQSSLSPFTTYYWRVRAKNICGPGPFQVSAFQTGNCNAYNGTGFPKEIPQFGAPSVITSTVNVGMSGAITDVNVVNLTGTHGAVNQLEFKLISPTGTEVILASELCTGNDQDFALAFDDDAATADPECPVSTLQTLIPEESLETFNGEEAGGTWTLQITDNVNFTGGEWTNWGLQLCVNGGLVLPEIIRNDTLFTTQWYEADISQALLEATDALSSPDELTFSLLTVPAHGGILLNGSNLGIGDAFTQKDINDGNISYLHNGDDANSDAFIFSVTNFVGGFTGTPSFNIQIATNTSIDPTPLAWSLEAFPNPAQDVLNIRTDIGSQETQVRLFDGQGRIVRQGSLNEQLQWSLQGLAAGLYLLEAENELGRQTQKILIRR